MTLTEGSIRNGIKESKSNLRPSKPPPAPNAKPAIGGGPADFKKPLVKVVLY